MIKGLDVSVLQGNIDWQAVAAAGYQFTIIRCYVGNSGKDTNYAKNVAGALAAGLKVACYHFIYPLPPLAGDPSRDPVAQAQIHFNAAQGQLACIDCEWPEPQDWAKWGNSSAQLNTWMLTYLQEYENLSGRKPIIYTYPYWAANVGFSPQFTQYPLWIASYQASPGVPVPWTTWVLWQSGQGHLPGSGVAVDLDFAQDLSLWDSVPVVMPAPVPTPMPVPTPAPVPVPVIPQPVPTPVPTPVVPPVSPLDSATIDNFLLKIWNFFMNFFKHTI
jgi:lysozyme